MRYLRNACFSSLTIVLCLVTLVLASCNSGLQNPALDSRPKLKAYLQVESTLLEGIMAHDINILRPIMSEPAAEKMELWLRNNLRLNCKFVMSEYRSSGSGGYNNMPSEIEQSNVTSYDALLVQIPCAGSKYGKYVGFYILDVHNVTFEYVDDTWRIQSWQAISEYIDR